MKKAFFSSVMCLVLALTACASPTSVNPTQPSSSDQVATVVAATMQAIPSNTPEPTCPEATEGTKLLAREAMGYCLLYPEGYIEVETVPTTVCLVPEGPTMGCHSTNLIIGVEHAGGRSANEIADAAISGAEAEVPGIEIRRTSLSIAGEEAVILEGLPGVTSSRNVLVVHEDRRYELIFVTWDETDADFARIKTLYDTVIASFTFLPIPAWKLPPVQELYVPANVQGVKFVAQESGMYKFELITGSYSVCPSGGAGAECGKWHPEVFAYVNREIAWTASADGSFAPAEPHFRLGSWLYYDTKEEAETHAGGNYQIPLQQGDFVWLLAPDTRDAYGDNAGGMTVSVLAIAPLP